MIKLPRSLTFKLIVAFLGVSLASIALVAILSWFAATSEFSRFVGQQAQDDFIVFVTDYYGENTSLHGIDQAIRLRVDKSFNDPLDRPRFFPFALATPDGVVVNPNEGYHLDDQVPDTLLATGTKILKDGQVIGIVLPRPPPFPRNRAQEQFVERTLDTLLISAGGAALLAIILGVVLARTITRPVQDLTNAAQRMAKGELGQTVRVQSSDEVGDLANAFNQMSADLQHADQVRRQMTADIAHELRNPLTVIGGYLDAMRTGDLQPTPKRLDAVYDEIQHLEGIVEDLRTLSLAEAGALVLNRQEVSPRELLQSVRSRFAPQAAQKNIALTVEADAGLPKLNVDDTRLTQVLDNLVSNALHHTPEGGAVTLAAQARENTIVLQVRDTGEGIAPEDLPRVFERFYRGDKARPTDEGSSGLGLAIASAIVNAHGGKIWVESELGKGAAFFVELPLTN
ncbi:MAG: HAMP domain-containing histidine kinase [Chloroflexota bacterium]|nr:MAG: HAMP domain-containing histidine kinase [Chloroflexota bacterium]